MNTEKIINETTQILCLKYYRKFFRSMTITLILSRLPFLRKNGWWLLWLQRTMVITLSKFQKAIKEGKKLIETETDIKKQELIQKNINANRYLARNIQTIADGIAWRLLNYNRQLLRLFSENSSSGSIDEEIPTIFGIRRNKRCKVIINDLTRYCRIGDFTIIDPKQNIILIEAKKRTNKKTGKNILYLNTIQDIGVKIKKQKRKELTNQEARQFIAQNAIMNNKIEIPIYSDNKFIKELEINIKEIDIPLKNHYKKIKKCIKKASKDIVSLDEVEKGYLVKIIAYDKVLEKLKNKESKDKLVEKMKIKRPEWTKNNDCIHYNNYWGYEEKNQQFARNLTPFSVLPFSSKDCTRITLGGLNIEIYFDIDVIKKKLENNGWVVIKEDWKKEYNQNKIQNKKDKKEMIMFKNKKDYVAFSVSKKIGDGTYNAQITITQILQLISTFYNTDTFVDMLEFSCKETAITKQNGLFAPNLKNENKILK